MPDKSADKVLTPRNPFSIPKPKRGFRRFVGVRVLKVVLPKKAIASEKATLKLGLWNIRSIEKTGKLDSVRSVFSSGGFDVMVLVETEASLTVRETTGATDWYNSGPQNEPSPKSTGIGFLVNHKNVKVIEFRGISSRIAVMRIMNASQKMSLIGCVAPPSTSAREEIATFYKELSSAICRVRNHGKYLVLGSFNCCIAQDLYPIFDGIIGESLDHVEDPRLNGCRLLTLCEGLDLEVSNTYFKKSDEERHTWKNDADQGATTDFVLEPKATHRRVCDVFARWQPEVESDHALLVVSYNISKQTAKPKETEVPASTSAIIQKVDVPDVEDASENGESPSLSQPPQVGDHRPHRKFSHEYVQGVISEAEALCDAYYAQKRASAPEAHTEQQDNLPSTKRLKQDVDMRNQI